MLHSATFKLTLWYVAIIMAISLLFSIVIYSTSVRELEQSFRRETIFYQLGGRIAPPSDDLGGVKTPQQLYDRAQHRLQLNLVIINAGILILAGGASYFLARRTLEPIEVALEAQGRFAADASHELRTPLTAMKAEIEVALRGKELPKAEARELLQSNLEEIDKLESLSAGLLKLAQQDQQTIAGTPVDIKDVMQTVRARLSSVIKARNVTINDQTTAIHVMGDRESLVELVTILVDNAIKYSPTGSTVTLTSQQHGHSVQVAVRDHGQGIRANDIPHIFDRFYRADTSRSRQNVEGYGLGLSIAQKIADLHGGAIEVSSKPDEGSTFMVKLPAA